MASFKQKGLLVDNDDCCFDCGYYFCCGLVSATISSIKPSSAEIYCFYHCHAVVAARHSSSVVVDLLNEWDVAADVVDIPFHIGDRRHRGSSEHHGGGVL